MSTIPQNEVRFSRSFYEGLLIFRIYLYSSITAEQGAIDNAPTQLDTKFTNKTYPVRIRCLSCLFHRRTSV